MTIPYIYYVNIILIPLLFGYLSAVNCNGIFRPKFNTWAWTFFYVLADGIGLGFQTLLGIRRIVLADTWAYSLILIAINFAIMTILLIIPRTGLRILLPHWEIRENIVGRDKVPEEKTHKKAWIITWRIVFFILYVLFLVIFFAFRWYEQTFDVDFDALLYTIAAPVKGTGSEVVETAMLKIIPPIVLALPIYWLSVITAAKRSGKYILVWGSNEKGSLRTVGFTRVFHRIVAGLLFVFITVSAVVLLKLPEYIISINQMSTIYEENYVDPNKVELTAENGKERNLIFIILESMETTYASTADGGRNKLNYIPNLTKLAEENISFSDTDKLGGFHSCTGTGWTMAATIATSSGVAFQFPVGQNALGKYESIAGGLTTLGDVLEKKGYALEAILGSDAGFAGTADFFKQHGGYKVYDLDDYYEDGYVEEDFYEWWGVRDEIEYKAAKDQLTKLAKDDKPFAVTMFTMDTHAPDGYICEICKETYDNQLGNVLECTDRQIQSFVDWCKKQEWYDNTTIVITGDHPRMDYGLIDQLKPADRRVYNCIINSAKKVKGETKNRTFTTLDIFPTIVSAMGFDIPGNMLGLGTDMLSGQETLAEKYGIDWLNHQLAMKSYYYMTRFY